MIRARLRLAFAALAFAAAAFPATAQEQPGEGGPCPYLISVPGIGACGNFSGNTCSDCGYRCQDDNVYHWNMC